MTIEDDEKFMRSLTGNFYILGEKNWQIKVLLIWDKHATLQRQGITKKRAQTSSLAAKKLLNQSDD